MPGSGSNPISRTELLIELRRNALTALHRQRERFALVPRRVL